MSCPAPSLRLAIKLYLRDESVFGEADALPMGEFFAAIEPHTREGRGDVVR
ncbi:hypothetical protein CJA_2279 [Cellvibrio japonicus Ueda107]|uniref:Uncharacterized protein n=1 Tax=Cellvibrio japonicus (strain Ueda107) TaxID=498211 RepID=B3PJR9_CELJU|nr:hypothetical protein CJA_2279 [Cellvibrio japonicus Ueda107]